MSADAKKPGAPGHNSGVAADRLRSFVERIERLEEERASLNADIREFYAEAKGNGFDVKTLRRIVALRRKEASDLQEEMFLLDTYMNALGMNPRGPAQ